MIAVKAVANKGHLRRRSDAKTEVLDEKPSLYTYNVASFLYVLQISFPNSKKQPKPKSIYKLHHFPIIESNKYVRAQYQKLASQI